MSVPPFAPWGGLAHAAGVIARAGGRSSNRVPSMGKEKIFWVYILASKIGGTLYIGYRRHKRSSSAGIRASIGGGARLHQTIRRPSLGLLRTIQRYRKRDPS